MEMLNAAKKSDWNVYVHAQSWKYMSINVHMQCTMLWILVPTQFSMGSANRLSVNRKVCDHKGVTSTSDGLSCRFNSIEQYTIHYAYISYDNMCTCLNVRTR